MNNSSKAIISHERLKEKFGMYAELSFIVTSIRFLLKRTYSATPLISGDIIRLHNIKFAVDVNQCHILVY